MAEIEIRLPKMGESVTEATITNWLKNPGENVSLDEPLVEVATDKVDNELPSEAEGILIKQLFEKDQVAQVGDVIAIISTDGDAPVSEDNNNTQSQAVVEENTTSENDTSEPKIEINITSNGNESIKISKNGSNGKYFSPLVRSIAEKEGIKQDTLDTISGSGLDGRVTKKDILAYVKGDKTSVKQSAQVNTPPASKPVSSPTKAAPIVVPNGEDEIIEMDRMRRLIADHMVMSKQVSPHVTSYVEADVTNIVEWRNNIKGDFKKREGENITYTPILI
ncbi:MAG: 2-oxo acid dehydrogenase subunit E2, partial [Flavobacteriales bacterium]|nr:2-oxo acid dehydrogenase subunit E2 [Flavobacteriales bacterium]